MVPLPRSQRGFTLLEVLIAVAIFALVGAGSYQVMNSVLRSQEIMEAHSQDLGYVQRAMRILAMDFEQMYGRGIRDEYGDHQPFLQLGTGIYPVEFTRRGWSNPLQHPRSTLQRVAYDFDGSTLLRHYWDVLDRVRDTEPRTQNLLEGVEHVQFRVVDSTGTWHEMWPPLEPILTFEQTVLTALELTIETEAFGEIRRVFPLAAVPLAALVNGAAGDNESPPGGEQP